MKIRIGNILYILFLIVQYKSQVSGCSNGNYHIQVVVMFSSSNVDFRVSEQVVSLVLPLQEVLLVPLLPDPAQTGHAPEGAGLDIPSESDDIQHYEQ